MPEFNEKMKKIIEDTVDEKIEIDNYLEKPMDDLGINSLTFMQLIVSVENEFDIEFDDDHLVVESYNSIKDFFDYIEGLATRG